MPSKNRRLGRALSDMGLNELLSDIKQSDQALQIQSLALSEVSPNNDQPRKTFSQASIEELAASIKIHGIIQPLVVQEKNNQYQIIAGERRYRAAKMIGLTHIPAIIKQASELEYEAIALIENIQRESLNVIDQAEAFARLIDTHNMSHEALAEQVSKSRSSVTNILRLNQLHPEVKALVRNQSLSMGHARAILAIPSERQPEFAQKAVAQSLSVRQVEALIMRMNKPKSTPATNNDWAQPLLTTLPITAKVTGSEHKGKLILSYKSQSELQSMIEQLSDTKVFTEA
ncbi:ParB/RepB/Spo0J family partition protein [Candidatus Comchoanobacter bicostacola]|uniref:ParB/RepB/Spo0J family partition protein n=1 Tax=Candidatus Comchoanobacter bicostacola TaxID=2919598 RepID=A0ABY5DKV6_9GAMM|nr:ParB/RepB/Spo0J family partition protein [Candidatus Comchoanobacter bicostacola]UTC24602.1 ParB/RepB/Spo0J family partition protein [Candidatus Comchoanobacter bicostacola]